MVGLSVVLESHRSMSCSSQKSPQVISKSSMMIRPSSSSSPTSSSSSPFFKRNCSNLLNFSAGDGFLQYCFLCKQKLLPGKDIYMYKGDKAFCSEECRCRQIFMDEEKIINGAKH